MDLPCVNVLCAQTSTQRSAAALFLNVNMHTHAPAQAELYPASGGGGGRAPLLLRRLRSIASRCFFRSRRFDRSQRSARARA